MSRTWLVTGTRSGFGRKSPGFFCSEVTESPPLFAIKTRWTT
ncbi:hypothetical protein WKW80_25400 [Variovorax humicola]|uniref:Uncharacterized protein n=1 Tax=Variovorax humicola TaxID=1769758 RepID=A0ABU8W7R3_9BURK